MISIGKNMYTIKVCDIMQGADFPTSGKILYSIISSKIDDVDTIVLDMSDVPLIPSMFLNTSIGRIITERGPEFLKSKITFQNIKASDAARVKDYVKRMSSTA